MAQHRIRQDFVKKNMFTPGQFQLFFDTGQIPVGFCGLPAADYNQPFLSGDPGFMQTAQSALPKQYACRDIVLKLFHNSISSLIKKRMQTNSAS